MDNTTLTIIGMLAAFITASVTAFLAEPIKNYFADRAKLQNIRIAIYKEIAQNSLNIDSFIASFDEDDERLETILKYWVSDKCYKNIIEHSVEEYYRLEDLIMIDAVYKWIKMILLAPENFGELIGFTAKRAGEQYLEFVSDSLKIGELNQKIMKRAVGKERLNKLLTPKNTNKKSTPPTKDSEQTHNGNSDVI